MKFKAGWFLTVVWRIVYGNNLTVCSEHAAVCRLIVKERKH